MNNPTHSDPAEHNALLRLFYRDWRPTRIGRWVNRFACWWSGLGLPPKFQAALEVRGRTSGRKRSNPVVIATLEGKRYLVSILGPASDWVKNVEAAHGEAFIRQGHRHPVHLVKVPPEQRAPILREYVRIASSGRKHFPVPVGAPLSEFQEIVKRYPVYRINVRTGGTTTRTDVRPILDRLTGLHVPGVQYVVVDANGIVFDYAGGWADIKKQRKMTAETTLMAYEVAVDFIFQPQFALFHQLHDGYCCEGLCHCASRFISYSITQRAYPIRFLSGGYI